MSLRDCGSKIAAWHPGKALGLLPGHSLFLVDQRLPSEYAAPGGTSFSFVFAVHNIIQNPSHVLDIFAFFVEPRLHFSLIFTAPFKLLHSSDVVLHEAASGQGQGQRRLQEAVRAHPAPKRREKGAPAPQLAPPPPLASLRHSHVFHSHTFRRAVPPQFSTPSPTRRLPRPRQRQPLPAKRSSGAASQRTLRVAYVRARSRKRTARR